MTKLINFAAHLLRFFFENLIKNSNLSIIETAPWKVLVTHRLSGLFQRVFLLDQLKNFKENYQVTALVIIFIDLEVGNV
jgi:hypothetical protein